MIHDLSTADAWIAQDSAPGVVDTIRHSHPALEARHTHANRVHSTRMFRLPVRVRFAFDWIDGDVRDDDPADDPAYLGIVTSFLQDEEHGYYCAFRADGDLQVSQEQVDYDGLGATIHDARPGDGRRHQVEVVWSDEVAVTLDGVEMLRVSRLGRFVPLAHGRVGLRLDRQHLFIAGFVVDELP